MNFMKKIAFLGVTTLAVFTLAACSSNSTSSSSSETSSGSKVSQSTTKKSSAPANTAVATDLTTGDWKVGTDVKPGTYVITSTGGSGNLQTGEGEVNAILTDNAAEAGNMYTSSVRAVLKDRQDLKISGLAGAHFEPAKSLNNISSGTLNAGVYVVGQDIKPGTYTIAPVKGGGNLMTDDGLVNEILGDGTDGMSVKSAHVNLKDGQTLTTTLESISIAQ